MHIAWIVYGWMYSATLQYYPAVQNYLNVHGLGWLYVPIWLDCLAFGHRFLCPVLLDIELCFVLLFWRAKRTLPVYLKMWEVLVSHIRRWPYCNPVCTFLISWGEPGSCSQGMWCVTCIGFVPISDSVYIGLYTTLICGSEMKCLIRTAMLSSLRILQRSPSHKLLVMMSMDYIPPLIDDLSVQCNWV